MSLGDRIRDLTVVARRMGPVDIRLVDDKWTVAIRAQDVEARTMDGTGPYRLDVQVQATSVHLDRALAEAIGAIDHARGGG